MGNFGAMTINFGSFIKSMNAFSTNLFLITWKAVVKCLVRDFLNVFCDCEELVQKFLWVYLNLT